MNIQRRIEALKRRLEKNSHRDKVKLTIDGASQECSLDRAFEIIQDEDYLRAHDVSFESYGNGSGHLAELLDGLTEVEE